MPQRFNGSWDATYPDQPQYTGHVRMEVRTNNFHFVSGDIFLSATGVFDGWWRGNNIQVTGDNLSMTYNIISTTGDHFSGRLNLRLTSPTTITGNYTDDNGGDLGRFNLSRINDQLFRQINVEVDTLGGVAQPPIVTHHGRNWDLNGVFEHAGVDLTVTAGNNIVIPNIPGTGIPVPLTNAQLHTFMVANHGGISTTPVWDGYLMMATTSPAGILGIMFDITTLPFRQGAAVFSNQITAAYPINADIAILRTTAHELGHALNLLHPNTHSTSIMNQTRVLETLGTYPDNTNYAFRDIAAEHLRHHRFDHVAFGGSALGSEPHAGEDTGPVNGENRQLKLSLSTQQQIISTIEPLVLNISLRNVSQQAALIDDQFCPTTGAIKFYLKDSSGNISHFRPPYISDVSARPISLPGGQEHTSSVILFLDRNGPFFNRPDKYVLYAVYSGDIGHPYSSILSGPLPLRVLHPTPTQERIQIELENHETKSYFVLDGADHLEENVKKAVELAKSKPDEAGAFLDYYHFIESKRHTFPFYDPQKDIFREACAKTSQKRLDTVKGPLSHNSFFKPYMKTQKTAVSKIQKREFSTSTKFPSDSLQYKKTGGIKLFFDQTHLRRTAEKSVRQGLLFLFRR